MDPAIVTLVSVVSAGLVSILSILVPQIIDWRRRDQDKKAAETEKINGSASALLAVLAHFRHNKVGDIAKSAECDALQVYSRLQSKYYAWERTVWPRLNRNEREQVKKLREEVEKLHQPDILAANDRKILRCWANEILSLTDTATESVQRATIERIRRWLIGKPS